MADSIPPEVQLRVERLMRRIVRDTRARIETKLEQIEAFLRDAKKRKTRQD